MTSLSRARPEGEVWAVILYFLAGGQTEEREKDEGFDGGHVA